jgi:hypothetical protein
MLYNDSTHDPRTPGGKNRRGPVLKKSYALILAILSFLSCSRKPGLLRETVFIDHPAIEIRDERCALFRTRLLDVSLQPIEAEDWEKLLAYEPFAGEKNQAQRVPRLLFIQMTAYNSGNRPWPLKDLSLAIVHGGTEKSPLTAQKVSEACASPAYSSFNFANLFAPRRLLTEKYCMKEIDYESDLIEYRLEFINPGERVLVIYAFEWLPVEVREFSLRATLKEGEVKKSIDFGVRRLEYRAKGTRFTKPEKPRQEQILED